MSNQPKSQWDSVMREGLVPSSANQDACLVDLGSKKVPISTFQNSLRMAFWGHSFWGSSASSDPPEQVWINYAYQCFNGGVGGETSTQIRTRFTAADPSYYKWPTHFWVGRNNITDLTTIMADLTYMVGVLEAAGNFDYIIYTDCTSSDDAVGGTVYNATVAYRTALMAFRPAKVYDAWQWGIDLADPGIPQDVIDKANKNWPTRLRRDTLHANLQMQGLIADKVVELTCARFDSARGMVPGWALPALMQRLAAKSLEVYRNARTDSYSKLSLGYISGTTHFVIGTSFGSGGSSTALVLGVGTVSGNTPEVGFTFTITAVAPYFQWSMGTVGASGPRSRITGTITGSNSGSHFNVAPTYTQSGAAAATDFLVNRTETSVGSGAQLFIDCQVGGASRFKVWNSGRISAILPTYADSTAAKAGSLVVGDFYQTSTGAVMSVI